MKTVKRFLWRNKWFILVVVVFLFFAVSYTKVALAGTDVELDSIHLAKVTDGFVVWCATDVYFADDLGDALEMALNKIKEETK